MSGKLFGHDVFVERDTPLSRQSFLGYLLVKFYQFILQGLLDVGGWCPVASLPAKLARVD
ncbi:UNVERIFIED_CONTAM: hypothetical protein Slati_3435900 [Sesamum latifolium]|uniref:Uncharacterized protein n=1 Tax=Sesamum latifolium TaxID=2727402 RepID=A0AAW2UII7_9LAMI